MCEVIYQENKMFGKVTESNFTNLCLCIFNYWVL